MTPVNILALWAFISTFTLILVIFCLFEERKKWKDLIQSLEDIIADIVKNNKMPKKVKEPLLKKLFLEVNK